MHKLFVLQAVFTTLSAALQIPLQASETRSFSGKTGQGRDIHRQQEGPFGSDTTLDGSKAIPVAEELWKQEEQDVGQGKILENEMEVLRYKDHENRSRILRDVPQYVLEYAPLVHLFSGEQFWPGDIAEHLEHVTPFLNYTPIKATTQSSNLTNLDKLNYFDDGRFVYLTSDDNVEDRPSWLGGEKNIPDVPETKGGFFSRLKDLAEKLLGTQFTSEQTQGGRSDAPAVLIVVDKGHGVVDAFWFYFYSYNLGNLVFNIRFGNHVGDWEHSLVRFKHGKPKFVFVSEHFFGQAYSYEAIEKYGKRPVIYSAEGTHAMYATPGNHPYILPLGLLHDQTDRGPLWDPALNSHIYTYEHLSDTLRASNMTPRAPVEWFYFNGHWGDKLYPLEDPRQYVFAGQYHYVTGPLGPRFKHLGRRKVCQGSYDDTCVIHHWLPPERAMYWDGPGEGEEEGWDRDAPGPT